ncbi:class I SAM-dependent methyltransferase [Gemmatimonas sp.]|uniref:class I SAM-dependent methyltransferase n=1 Tax=Gemmatimonas sp. TaxID=1962908 RepID=UPI0037BFC355
MSSSAYQTWQIGPAHVGDRSVPVASKPGVMAHGSIDTPAMMMAEWISAMDTPAAGARSLHLASGNGLVPAVAMAVGFAPDAFDRYKANAESTRRSLAAAPGVVAGAYAVHHEVLANDLVPATSCALATIRIPTDKHGVQQAVAEAFRALAVGGVCLIAGANDEGAKPAAKLLAQVFGHARLDAQHSSCRLLVATKLAEAPVDASSISSPWLDQHRFHEVPVTVADDRIVLSTRPGVFSWEHLDEASGILGDIMRIAPGESVLDLGCGSGVLGVLAARQSRTGRVVLLDADADAVRCARRTATAAGCRNVEVRASDVTDAVADEAFDVVLSNPPFHLGKGTDLAIPRAFIEQAYARLLPGGRLYLVANRTLPYESLIDECFGEVRTAHDGRRFKVIGAVRRV